MWADGYHRNQLQDRKPQLLLGGPFVVHIPLAALYRPHPVLPAVSHGRQTQVPERRHRHRSVQETHAILITFYSTLRNENLIDYITYYCGVVIFFCI